MRRISRRMALLASVIILLQVLPALAVSSFVRINAVEFLDDATGYITGANWVGSRPFSFVARTLDGGATWTPVTIPNYWSTRVSVGDDGSAAVALDELGAVVFSDGSATSTSSVLPGGSDIAIKDVEMLSSGAVVAVGQHKATPAGSVGFIGRSADDGATWASAWEGPVYTPPNEEDPAPTTTTEIKAVDSVRGTTRVWAVGTEHSTTTRTVPWGIVMGSADDGVTWTREYTAVFTLAGQYAVDITAPTVDAAFMVASNQRCYRTNTGGASWSSALITSTAGAFSPTSIDALDATRMIAGSEQGRIAWSLNGGVTWTSKLITSKWIRGVDMVTETHWVVVGDDELLLHTYDAGVTWSGSTGLAGPVTAVSAPASGFAVGPDPLAFSGTAADSGVGVASVKYSVRRSDGKYWTGSAWTSVATTHTATLAGGAPVSWSATVLPDVASVPPTQTLTLRAVGIDALGTSGAAVWVTSSAKRPPVLTFATPAHGSVMRTEAVSITGTATGDGVDVVGVSYTIERSDGLWWDGAAWGSTPASLSASLVPSASTDWSASWTPDIGTLSAGHSVTVTARAIDAGGLVSDPVSVTLAPPSRPSVSLATPSPGFVLQGDPVSIAGTATGDGIEVVSVSFTIERSDGLWWDGAAWASTPASLSASLVPSVTAEWSASWTPDPATVAAEQTVTIAAWAEDEVGLVSTVASVMSTPPPVPVVELATTGGPGEPLLVTGIATFDALPVEGLRVDLLVQGPLDSAPTTTGAYAFTDANGEFAFSRPPANAAISYAVSFRSAARRIVSDPVGITTDIVLTTPHVAVDAASGRAVIGGSTGTRHAPGGEITLRFERLDALSRTGGWTLWEPASAAASRAFLDGGRLYSHAIDLPGGRWRVTAVHEDADHLHSESATTVFDVP